jgi:hypothetical protein
MSPIEKMILDVITKPAPTPTPLSAADPAMANAAVARCCDAYATALDTPSAKRSSYEGKIAAEEAYRRAMPPLDGHQNICDFIACTAHGLLLGTIPEQNVTRLLYAAQVANSSAPKAKPTPPQTTSTQRPPNPAL